MNLTLDDVIRLHIEDFGMHPNDCKRCQKGEGITAVKWDDGGLEAVHTDDLEVG